MPITSFLHSHVLIVVLFLLLFTYKVILLLLNKQDVLTRVRNKTKVVEMVLGTLVLVTGGWLFFNYTGAPVWLITKIVLVSIAVPLGIVGLRRNNKVLAVLALLIFAYVYGVAESDSLTMQQNNNRSLTSVDTPETDAAEAGSTKEYIVASMNNTALANAKEIYVNECSNCHGQDGTNGLSGAPNLTRSQLNQNDRALVIANGRGMMPGYGRKLSEQEIEELAAYTMTFNE
ncbi:c-type cytochrome [Pontibacter burrus]|uniref:Cytochrome c domain-containing protein n=1 Tax=Pontibacter burrus TaxID=2704466 RepID=A0A6B3LL12_9BACT|nr:SirB2 family protein [Pontibacter burrus]NEM96653.1 hypothetical protein [Pontibacter burrus]